MADDKTRTDNRDRSQVARGEDHEIAHLAEEAGITLVQARALIKRHGTDRKVLHEIAESIRVVKADAES
ncbi:MULTISPECIES: DUF3606 domain-containing protein [unclassified Mesorhizobium]|uniref:DUF3606 domain-containing protein n=1 Tax=unclassified Mesorhizobium TaxID=325217 RepID=UPI000FD939E5|nr:MULTISPECIES: DUF3606 domain-containing protein [unclassified Mesorhizobium]TGQ33926.1 DUF3606 domain-containing protein [Mesorhizobium sp. M00.F.Ca.ET.216.01.1.1]TIS91640.1 MAG: DUF3606 domain-containing protein [Mesorhizobium sp.]TJW10064.1 MAG: DUF3606 domain-containing protein [Mesorhizobium sp.]